MSLMINGQLHEDWLDAETEDGEFVRQDSQFRHWVTPDGSPGPSGEGGFAAEPGRYHLYVSYACPWAHRTLIFRKLKKLEDIISVSVVHPHMGPKGWDFRDYPDATGDTLYGYDYMHQLYTRADPHYSGIVTVPALWDKQHETIVNNESAEIIRMFNSAFDAWADDSVDMYPAALREAIDEINEAVYEPVNNGVYRTGFASTQEAYEKNFDTLFAALDELEQRLSKQRYLLGSQLTEADWRLFPTLLRFDPVYVGHFKCNKQRIADYPNLFNYLLELYQMPGIADTTRFEHIKQHYYYSHVELNPTRIVPKGPVQDLLQPHNRGELT
ncbi:glutathione S-transferase family protein [Thiohalophilus thiocyanatoxydans]|uniref:Putative glutathione S-transferase n=1 Tax=Thiohalophilus thiocyanatoxydans TaxID=381308 RepID=A0A4R8IJG8_9GAMM|nr:glutathione S-transferase family protein [Thiohalophilus thiocyanatoxydans]TDY00488.1 putative glutathione S-transferase [Thiohalophilus thiocyanatoxydans]